MNLSRPLFSLFICFLLFSCNALQKEETAKESEIKVESSEISENTETQTSEDETETPKSKTPTQATVLGIDLKSLKTNPSDFLNQKGSWSFGITKASEGNTYSDPNFRSNWRSMKMIGISRGAYHLFRADDQADLQAAHFVHSVSELDANDLPLIVSFDSQVIDATQSVEFVEINLLTFLKILESKTNRKPIIQTDTPTANKYLRNPQFADYPLWLITLKESESARIPKVWSNTSWTFRTKIDSNLGDSGNQIEVFNGDSEAFIQFLKE